MNEDFVSFSLAKKLKEKGFRWDCFAYYMPHSDELIYNVKPYKGVTLYSFNSLRKELISSDFIDAPTIAQVLKWLREGKKMYIEPCILVDYDTDADNNVINTYTYWSFSITSIESGDMIYYEYEHIDDKRFDSYEQSAIAGIEYVIDNLI